MHSGGGKISYTVQGSGSPVLLIHGLHGSGAANWTLPGIIAALAKSHRVIVMDCRGHGKSGKPATEAEYGVQIVDNVIALLNHLEVRQAHLVGDRNPVDRLYVQPLAKLPFDWPVTKIEVAGHINCIAKAAFREAVVQFETR